MTDIPVIENDSAQALAKPKRKGVKRRAFLVGSAAIVGGGIFAVAWGDSSAAKRARALTIGWREGSFSTWLKIGVDDTVTLYSPHIDFGQGSQTALAQMAADELDANWDKVKVLQAPAETAFANTPLGKAFVTDMTGMPGIIGIVPNSVFSMLARNMPLQITGGSSAVRFTGQFGMRIAGAAARLALLETAAERFGVPVAELSTANSVVTHVKSGKTLRYGELAEEAAQRSLSSDPKLKDPKDYKLIGKPVKRFDIPAKINGTAEYGIDINIPEMRVATVIASPIRGGKLLSVDIAPAMAIKGVEKVLKLESSVVVVANGYWPALKGARALAPKFSDEGKNAGFSTASIFTAQDNAINTGKPTNSYSEGDVAPVFSAAAAKSVESKFRLPFLHQAMMEPFALTAYHKDGKLELWGGLQDPLLTKMMAAEAAGLSADDVTFNTTLMGGGFGRRFPGYSEIIGQAAKVAMQLPYPVKLIWSREEEVQQGAYRPQSSAKLKAALGKDGKIAAWRTDYAQFADAESETVFPYVIPAVSRNHYEYRSNQTDAFWRSVNSTQHGFYNESFMDEMAAAAGEDPYQFRRKHLPAGSRHLKVLDEAAKRAGWGTPLPAGTGRGIALVESFKTIVAEVVEVSLKEDGTPKLHNVYAVVDCGTTVNPLNAEAQIMGGIIMGLSAAIGEEITLENGAVVQSNFHDYPVMQLADAPARIDVHFIESGTPMGGIGEPGLPPAAPALANALFAVTGKRIRNLPIKDQAKV